jgi:hypothetical protein
MSKPVYFHVKPEQVGRESLSDFLRNAIIRQFEGKEYYIAKEEDVERPTPYSVTPRKLRGFMINEGNAVGHAIWFDVTDCSASANFWGR